MQDGYYLSTFLAFDPLCNSLGVALRHDQNVSLWHKSGANVKLIKVWELERLSGLKGHHVTLANRGEALDLLARLLEEVNLNLEEIVEIWGTSGLERKKQFHHHPTTAFHNVAHMFSALYANGSATFRSEPIIGLAVDAGPDNLWEEQAFTKAFYTGAVARNGEVELFPISSPGILWCHASERTGLREGTLMALATATRCQLVEPHRLGLAPHVILDRSDWPTATAYVDKLLSFVEHLTPNDQHAFTSYDYRFSHYENMLSSVMKEVQRSSIALMVNTVTEILDRTGLTPATTALALSGGFSLNCPTNSALMQRFGFSRLLAPPTVNDSGISIGQALYYFHYESDIPICVAPIAAGMGQAFQNYDVKTSEYASFVENTDAFEAARFVADVSHMPVVWFDGASEIGPRALGHRSILSDPRHIRMKDALNVIKQREWWRPVAPVVLERHIGLIFADARRSPFMLELFDIRDGLESAIPAVNHLDSSARVQTVTADDNPRLALALEAFFNVTGVPLLCNTSLNDKSEPIINHPDEAFNFALRKGLSVVYLNGMRIQLKDHKLFTETEPASRPLAYTNERRPLEITLNPHNLSADEITVYWDYKHIYPDDALQDRAAVDAIRAQTQSIIHQYGYLMR